MLRVYPPELALHGTLVSSSARVKTVPVLLGGHCLIAVTDEEHLSPSDVRGLVARNQDQVLKKVIGSDTPFEF
jgi:hypothetical protein